MARTTNARSAAAASANDGTSRRPDVVTGVVVALLAASAVAVVIGTTLMPASYSWVRHSVSEAVGQGVHDAWVTRLGFLLLGFAVLLLAGMAQPRWGPLATLLFRVYGVSMIATAAFAHKPWRDVPFDVFEDVLHSVTASAIGVTFTFGVVLVALRRGRELSAAQAFDGFAVICALVISLMVTTAADLAGLAQRVMFAVGYTWFTLEAVRATR